LPEPRVSMTNPTTAARPRFRRNCFKFYLLSLAADRSQDSKGAALGAPLNSAVKDRPSCPGLAPTALVAHSLSFNR
jgi:hypothetical protein